MEYVAADLLAPPDEWTQKVDFVLEVYTVQALPIDLRSTAIERVASFVKPGGSLLILASEREANEPVGQMPWPLSRPELAEFVRAGLKEESFENYLDDEDPPSRRFRVLYTRPA